MELVADLVADLNMPLSLPIYKRVNTYVLHLRVAGKQIKRSLGTLDRSLAKIRAMQLLGEILTNSGAVSPASPQGWRCGSSLFPREMSFSHLTAGETWAQAGSAKFSEVGHGEDPVEASHNRKWPAEIITPLEQQPIARKSHELPSFFAPKSALEDAAKFKLSQVFENYISVRKIREVTVFDYSVYSKEISRFFRNTDIRLLTDADVNALITHLRIELKNDARTVDNKVGFLRAVINHLIKQKVFLGANPASAKNLVSKRERRQGGTKPIAYNSLKEIFGDHRFASIKTKRPEIYLIVMTGLVTGMRVSSVARLQAQDLKVSMKGTAYIDISADKTVAGNRDIPVPLALHAALKTYLAENDGFGLTKRDAGKGFSDAVNKPIKAYLKEHRLDGIHEKLSFHAFRKSFNDHLLKNGVEHYICGAVLGHVDETMTTGIYATTPSVDTLWSRIGKYQEEILAYMNFKSS